MDELLSVVKSVIPNIDLFDHHKLVTDGVINSLSFVMLFTAISDHYGIEIPFDDMIPENFDSIEAISALIERLQKSRGLQ